MTYNIHPSAGNGQEIKSVLRNIGLTEKQSQDVIDDAKEAHYNGDRASIREIVSYINNAYGSNIVCYKDVDYWNKGTRKL